MKEVTQIMVKDFKIYQLGYDFMAYKVDRKSKISFHHTIISHKECRMRGLGEGYWKWNGSILVQDTSHDYLHLIEKVDNDMFKDITMELVDENIKGKLDIENLKRIHDILSCFEKEHCGDTNHKGKVLIKELYTRRIKL